MAGTTIADYEMSWYNLYALRTRSVEEIQKQYQLNQAATVTSNVVMPNYQQVQTELDMLFPDVRFVQNPFANFKAPPIKKHNQSRRSPFAFWRIAPSLGTLEEQEKLEAMVDQFNVDSNEEIREKKAIQSCFKQMNKLNSMLGFIVGRVGQFLQG